MQGEYLPEILVIVCESKDLKDIRFEAVLW